MSLILTKSLHNAQFTVHDASLPQCKTCIVRYNIYQCGHYSVQLPYFAKGHACATCCRSHPTTIPRIKGDVLDSTESCLEGPKCVERMQLPFCKRNCATQIIGYNCGCLSIKDLGGCGGCRTPTYVTSFDASLFDPMTRSAVVFTLHWNFPENIQICSKCEAEKRHGGPQEDWWTPRPGAALQRRYSRKEPIDPRRGSYGITVSDITNAAFPKRIKGRMSMIDGRYH
ncbi:hypothetical protein DSL72_006991 [Monilinia vaccinii-corymbosi]|uniref:Uncharacterized protein n=1 Tax=Monilinia vaccinii-corymbosi TaxID=61207 RepID=A0A8A3PLM8_9HELO|nr:hypothetical protein DSL72_006991 [Monilinia vaccinii-corymbosi]